MKDKKSIVDIYETIYGIDLVVANRYTTVEDLNEEYSYYDGAELDSSILDGLSAVALCKRISDGKRVILAKYNRDSDIKGIDKKVDFINTITHEAGHVVLDIYSAIDQDIKFDSQEPFCYLLGWVGECLYKTWTK